MVALRLLTLLTLLALLTPLTLLAKDITFGWNYIKHQYEAVEGFRLYMGDTMVADIPKAETAIEWEQPYLIEEDFDADPGTKYPLAKGSWTWVAETKAMHVEGGEFMIVFDVPAGVQNAMSFWFWPQASSGDQPIVYAYLKDEALSAYYELRFAGADGIRFSNWRKVYDQQFGGVEGAFALNRYPQCAENPCQGFSISMDWADVGYSATIYDQATKETYLGGGIDTKPLNINKLEIITQQQSFWIDAIKIGGLMELRASAAVDLPAQGQEVQFALSAYNANGEGPTSIPLVYVVPTTTLETPVNLRKKD